MKTRSAVKHVKGFECKSCVCKSQVLRHTWYDLRLFYKKQEGKRVKSSSQVTEHSDSFCICTDVSILLHSLNAKSPEELGLLS